VVTSKRNAEAQSRSTGPASQIKGNTEQCRKETCHGYIIIAAPKDNDNDNVTIIVGDNSTQPSKQQQLANWVWGSIIFGSIYLYVTHSNCQMKQNRRACKQLFIGHNPIFSSISISLKHQIGWSTIEFELVYHKFGCIREVCFK
jgi:hypothetical protein